MDANAGKTPARAALGMLGPRAVEYARVIAAQAEMSPDVVLALLAHAYIDGLVDATPKAPPGPGWARRGRLERD
jgi:hypothetical protein